MRKAKIALTPESNDNSQNNEKLAPIIPLRTPSTLTRYPIHRLTKKGTVKIYQSEKGPNGEVLVRWEVRNPPGPLAYKIETIIIKAVIDKYRPNIPICLRLYSLSEMCRILGLADSGKNRLNIKEALYESAEAFIKSKLKIKGVDGRVHKTEFGGSRFNIYFIGDQLPNGKMADAVYIYFHESYRNTLQDSQTRPLDYNYLLVLPPAAQRLYEILSPILYGAIKYNRDCATMLYSELCISLPITRNTTWDKAKKQLYKLHKPHINSGYLKSISFEEIVSSKGHLDWLIRYVPGKKAKREYATFTKNQEMLLDQVEEASTPLHLSPRLYLSSASEASQDPKEGVNEKDISLINRLKAYKISDKRAKELVEQHPEECERQLDALPSRDLSKVKNTAAWLVKAISEGYEIGEAVEKKHQEALTSQQKEAEKQAQANCGYCEQSPGWRMVYTEQQPNGAAKKCTHNPEIEGKYRSSRFESEDTEGREEAEEIEIETRGAVVLPGCNFCHPLAPGYHRIESAADPDGEFRQCTHNPLIEKQFRTIKDK